MTHPRKLTRDAIKDRLDGLERGGQVMRFYTNRIKELTDDVLPAGVIVTELEASERADKSGRLDRTVSLEIILVFNAEHSKDIDDEADDWAERVENRLRQAPIPGVSLLTLTNTQLEVPIPEDGELWYGAITLEFQALLLA